MKKILLILLFFFGLGTFTSQAQDGERIRKLKIAFITERLDLSVKEAQQFWPVYNAYEEEVFQLRNVEMRKLRNNLSENFNDTQASKALDRMLEIEASIHQANVRLVNDLKPILPARKIILLKKAEQDFNKELLERIRKNRKRRMGNRP